MYEFSAIFHYTEREKVIRHSLTLMYFTSCKLQNNPRWPFTKKTWYKRFGYADNVCKCVWPESQRVQIT